MRGAKQYGSLYTCASLKRLTSICCAYHQQIEQAQLADVVLNAARQTLVWSGVTCRRRYAVYKASHEGDTASQHAFQAAQQLWWDDKRTLLEAAAAAEADAAKAANAQ